MARMKHVSVLERSAARASLHVESIRARVGEHDVSSEVYKSFVDAGFQYGPRFQRTRHMYGGDGEALSVVCAMDEELCEPWEMKGFALHPAVLENATHTIMQALPRKLLKERRGSPFLPAGFDEVVVSASMTGKNVWVHTVLSEVQSVADSAKFDVVIADFDSKEVLVEMRGFRVQRARGFVRVSPVRRAMYALEWHVAEPSAQEEAPGSDTDPTEAAAPQKWLVVIPQDEREGETAIIAAVRRCVPENVHVHVHTQYGGMDASWDDGTRLLGEGEWTRVLYVLIPGAGEEDAEGGQQARAAYALMTLLRSLSTTSSVPLTVLTRGVQSGEDWRHSWVTGLVRTARMEHPSMQIGVVDLSDKEPSDSELALGLAFSGTTEDVWVHDEQCWTPQLAHPALTLPFSLELKARGSITNAFLLCDDVDVGKHRPLAPTGSYVEVVVRAVGLNFRDVLNVLDMYPGGDPGDPCSDFAGEVISVEGKSSFSVGDAVFGFADRGCLRSHMKTSDVCLAVMPAVLSFEQAAALPTVFLTVMKALEGLEAGEKVLIHAASGGVGLAAVQYAQRVGAEVYATAGAAVKHDFLRSLGVEHIVSSRDAEAFKQSMGEVKVDVVLNSLSEDYIPFSLDMLSEGGTFVDIGKRGVWSHEQLRTARPDVRYELLALHSRVESDFLAHEPGWISGGLQRLADDCMSGNVKPLPTIPFDMREDTQKAMVYMSQAKHIGKVVLTNPSYGVPVVSDGTYVISGGLGALGLVTAQHLASRGARHLVLLSRSGKVAESMTEQWQQLRNKVELIHTPTCDVADAEALWTCLGGVLPLLPPVRGVVHAAGVLDDKLLGEQTAESVTNVFRPKVQGAMNLHELSLAWAKEEGRAPGLDFFFCFTSMAGVLGNAGQANYAAANTAVDGLMRHRRHLGLAGTSLQWGPWADVGMAAQLDIVQKQLELAGVGTVSAELGMAALDAAAMSSASVGDVAVLPGMDWGKFAGSLGASRCVPILADLVAADAAGSSSSIALSKEVREELSRLSPGERQQAVRLAVLDVSRELIGKGAEALDANTPLMEAGLDSLSTVELRTRLQSRFGVNVTSDVLFLYPTVTALAAWVEEEVLGADSGPLNEQDDQTTGAGANGSSMALLQSSSDTDAPAAYQQEHMYFSDVALRTTVPGGGSVYNLPVVLPLPVSLISGRASAEIVDMIAQVLGSIVERHDVLRTALEWTKQGSLRQVQLGITAAQVVSAGLSSAVVSSVNAARSLIEADIARPFDLEQRQPLWRTLVVHVPKQSGEEEHYTAVSTFHHGIFDGASYLLFNAEFKAVCAAVMAGQGFAQDLPALPFSFADYSRWQRVRLDDEGSIEELLEYWEGQLAGTTPLQLPLDRTHDQRGLSGAMVNEGIQERGSGKVDLVLPSAVVAKLSKLCAGSSATLFVGLMGAFQVLLARVCATEDVMVGTAHFGRDVAQGLEGVLGCFVNTLAFRLGLGGSPSFREVLLRVQVAYLGAMKHAEAPFHKVVERAQLGRDDRGTALQAFFVLQEGGVDTWKNATDIELYLVRSTDSASDMHGSLCYNTAVFDQATVETLGRSFLALLESAVGRPGESVWKLSILAHEDRVKVVETLSGAALVAGDANGDEEGGAEEASPPPPLLHAAFVEMASRSPEQEALHEYETGRVMSYGELNGHANAVACMLQGRGVGPECLVGVLIAGDCVEAVVTVLGVLKAGAAYVPLDPEHPDERLSMIAQDAGLSVVLTTEKAVGESEVLATADASLARRVGDVSCVDVLAVMQVESTAEPVCHAVGENMAYVIHTSGSTGRPKGVMIEHRSTASFMATLYEEELTITASSRVLLSAALTFDVSVASLFGPLSCGATLCLAAKGSMLNDLPEVIRSLRVTDMYCTPSLLSLLRPEDITNGSKEATLRSVALIGEPIKQGQVDMWRHRLRLVNSYGPTEATIAVTAHEYSSRAQSSGFVIGKPRVGVQVYVVDKRLQLVPQGVEGELCIGGRQLARGYLNRPELTSKAFIPAPFLTDQCRVYRTGDLVRQLADGSLVFRGRRDSQVKVRGYRIELGEVEAALLHQEGVRSAVAAVDRERETVVAALTPSSAKVEMVLQGVSKLLPAYMVPSKAVAVDALPMTSSGKRDVKEVLRVIRATHHGSPGRQRSLGVSDDAPMDDTTRQVLGIMREAVGRPDLRANDDLFAGGGTSLSAAQAVSRIRTEVPGFEALTVMQIFQNRTAAALSVLVSVLGAAEEGGGRGESGEKSSAASEARVEDEERDLGSVGGGGEAMKTHRRLSTGKQVKLQILSWLLVVAVLSGGFSPSFVGVYLLRRAGRGNTTILSWLPLLVVVSVSWVLALIVVVKWTVLGRMRPGRWSVRSSYYWRWYAVQNVLKLAALLISVLRGTFALRVWNRLLGARISGSARLESWLLHEHDLIEVGEEAVIEYGAVIRPSVITRNGMLHVHRVRIGKGAKVGILSNVCPSPWEGGQTQQEEEEGLNEEPKDLVIGEGMELGPYASLGHSSLSGPLAEVEREQGLRRIGKELCALALLSVTNLGSYLLPLWILVLAGGGGDDGAGESVSIFARALAFPVLLLIGSMLYMVAVLSLQRIFLLLGPGATTRLSLAVLQESPLFKVGSLIVEHCGLNRAFASAMGASLEQWCALLTLPITTIWEKLRIGENSQLAGRVHLFAERGARGDEDTQSITIGRFSIVANEALLLGGACIGDGSTVADRTVVSGDDDVPCNSSVVGAPRPFVLPNPVSAAAEKDGVDAATSLPVPSRAHNALRGLATVVLLLGVWCPGVLISAWASDLLLRNGHVHAAAAFCPFVLPEVVAKDTLSESHTGVFFLVLGSFVFQVLMALAGACSAILFHRVLGTSFHAREGQPPIALDSPSLNIYRLGSMGPALIEALCIKYFAGGPVYAAWLRLLGASVGKDTSLWLGPEDAHLLVIGDAAVVLQDSTIFAHTIEGTGGFVFKTVQVGENAWLGVRAHLQPGCRVEAGANVGDLSMAMRGESVTNSKRGDVAWVGIPLRKHVLSSRALAAPRHHGTGLDSGGGPAEEEQNLCKMGRRGSRRHVVRERSSPRRGGASLLRQSGSSVAGHQPGETKNADRFDVSL